MFSRLLTYLNRLPLIFLVPSMVYLYPALVGAHIPFSSSPAISQTPRFFPRYDDILNLIELVENECLEEICTSEQIEIISHFLAILARNGLSENDPVALALLDQDIETHLCAVNSLQFHTRDMFGIFSVQPAVYLNHSETQLCKSWVSKQCYNIKKFVKKHKKAIIIGGVIVVGVGVGVVIIPALIGTSAASSAVAAAGAATAALAEGGRPDRPSPNASLFQSLEESGYDSDLESIIGFEMIPRTESEVIEIIDSEVKALREFLVQDASILQLNPGISNEITFAEKARKIGSHFAHKILDEAATFVSVVPQVLQEISILGSKTLPESMTFADFDGNPIDAVGNFNNTVFAFHEKIDDAFSTSFAKSYTPEAEENHLDFTIGMLPPPGGILNGTNLSKVARGKKTAIFAEESGLANLKIFENNSQHIFRNAPGHLVDTPSNRILLIETASNPNNYLGKDKFGNNWYAQIREDGKQIWASERNGQIRNGGLNDIPYAFDPQTGLVGNGGS